MRIQKYTYEVWIDALRDYDGKIYNLALDKAQWFRTQTEAIKYAKQLKRELKDVKFYNNYINIDVNKYLLIYENDEVLEERLMNIVCSINLLDSI